jgi:hypothetical protein
MTKVYTKPEVVITSFEADAIIMVSGLKTNATQSDFGKVSYGSVVGTLQ